MENASMSIQQRRPVTTVPRTLLIISLALVVLGALFQYVPYLLECLNYPEELILRTLFTDGFITVFRNALHSLFLPMCLLLVMGTTKPALPRFLTAVGGVYLAIQLFSILIALICAMAKEKFDRYTDYYNSLYFFLDTMIALVPGKAVLTQLLNFCEIISENHSLEPVEIMTYFMQAVLYMLSALLYIVSNMLCTIGFIKLSIPQRA